MANVKTSLAQNYYRESNHGFDFDYPHQRTTKPTTETILNGIASTTTEIANHIYDNINRIFANINDTQNASNSTDILTSNNDVQNNTFVDVNVGSNATATENNITAIIPDIFNTNNISTEAVQNSTEIGNTFAETLTSTTENIMNYFTNRDSDIITSTGKMDTNMTAEHDMHTGDKTAHIIITVLVIILFLIGLGLFGIYMYYKKRNTANITAQYHTRGSREIATSDTNPNDTVVVHQEAC